MSGAYGTIKGILFKSPEVKKSKSGNDYTSATLKVKDNTETRFWKVLAFKDAAQSLMNFSENDFIQAEGSIKCEPYSNKENSPAVGLTLMANSVQAYSPPQKQSQDTAPRPEVSRPTLAWDYRV